jgi:hypothetical protein
MATCNLCGRTEDEQPLTWTTSVERGVTRLYCEQCSRENVRGIEGKLEPEWW